MIACDVNVLVSAYNQDDPRQPEFGPWLERTLNGVQPVGMPSLALSGFMRIMTNPRIVYEPLSSDAATDVVEKIMDADNVVTLDPGPKHWTIFVDLCRRAEVVGNLVPDAYLAAVAIEHGCEWITDDRGFARYPGLRWRHPLD